MNKAFEKILDGLDEMIHPKQLYFCKYSRGGCKHLYNNDKDCMECIVENAIEIVKHGAVSDDVCEWKYNYSEYYFESSCDHLHIFMSDGPKENEYDFCPYCGKKIKGVE